ncbi:hypothetical protein QJS04_geneDACA003284 [Acorus gramineus]|uniref:Uncharacterized protein n=1 Tax=Acorus gramineus TaxID=55184 RepID=A0AAV9BNG5_ACOGR|nr:hypothetical protein QJS04_geneDACA003284 [Acorus gramineus]
MKCRRHPCEQGVGVCASCLRERLLSLIDAQLKLSEEEQSQQTSQRYHHHHRRSVRLSPPPELPSFPRSVSPYICRGRRSVDSDVDVCRPRFYSTPQVGGRAAAAAAGGPRRKFSIISSLFGSAASRSEEIEHRSKSSWLSALFPGRRRKKSAAEVVGGGARSKGTCRAMEERGLSPEEGDSPASDSGYSTESSIGRRRPAMTHPTPMRRRGAAAAAAPFPHVRNLSGMAFCLSPLVWASPNGRRNQTPESVHGESHHRHAPSRASLCANRSRKIADFGRYRH